MTATDQTNDGTCEQTCGCLPSENTCACGPNCTCAESCTGAPSSSDAAACGCAD